MRIIYGIDPGFSGAVACIKIDETASVWVQPMPIVRWTTATKGKTRSRGAYDEAALRRMLAAPIIEARKGHLHPEPHVYLERQQAMRGREDGRTQGTVSSFATGEGYGLLRGLCVGLGIPVTIVSARTWQSALLKGCACDDTKRASILVAQRLYPTTDLRPNEKCRVPSNGMSDALLIATWGARQQAGVVEA